MMRIRDSNKGRRKKGGKVAMLSIVGEWKNTADAETTFPGLSSHCPHKIAFQASRMSARRRVFPHYIFKCLKIPNLQPVVRFQCPSLLFHFAFQPRDLALLINSRVGSREKRNFILQFHFIIEKIKLNLRPRGRTMKGMEIERDWRRIFQIHQKKLVSLEKKPPGWRGKAPNIVRSCLEQRVFLARIGIKLRSG